MAFLGLFGSKKEPKTQVVETANTLSGQATKVNDAVSKFAQGLIDIKDIIAPSAIEIDFNHIKIGTKFFRSYFAVGYPSHVVPNWLAPLINFEYPIDIATFYYPRDTKEILENLRNKIAQLEASLNIEASRGVIQDPTLKVALEDARELQQSMASGNERFFQYGLYMTIRANTLEELETIAKNLESTLAAIGVLVKPATLQQEQAFQSTVPYGLDKIEMYRNMDTTSLATTFPFTSSELTMEKGILYGINLHNRSLVIFDRFSMPNANTVVFATSGAGKSYTVKLEALRSLMLGIEIIIIDPENEYKDLCDTVGGEYISFSQDGAQKLNPFELSGLFNTDEDELRFKILSLNGLVRMMMGGNLTPEESAILDRALILTFKEKGITPDPRTHKNEPPLLEDLYKIFQAMAENEAHGMATRLEKYVRGSAAGVFDQASNVNLQNQFTVFSIRDLVDDLRPMAMYVILDYIWTKVKKDKRKRLLIIDEAWVMMQYPDAARFVFSIAKRARKYALGLTTITQDINDFLSSDYGKAIVNNAAIQLLLKQTPSAIEVLQKTFYLTEGEKLFLLSAGVGEGIFFAGRNHVAIQVVASENEHNLITTNPNELLAREEQKKLDESTEVIAEQNRENLAPEIQNLQQEMNKEFGMAQPPAANGNSTTTGTTQAETPQPSAAVPVLQQPAPQTPTQTGEVSGQSPAGQVPAAQPPLSQPPVPGEINAVPTVSSVVNQPPV